MDLLPPNILSKMSPEDRAALGENGKLPEEHQAKADLRLEREIHGQISNELTRRGIFFIHSRTDKKSTTKVGTPDFVFCLPGPIPIATEVKLPGKKLTEEQEQVGKQMQENGWFFYVVHSFQEFHQVIKTWAPS